MKIPKEILQCYNTLDGKLTLSSWWDSVETCSAGWHTWVISVFQCQSFWWNVVGVCSARWCQWVLA